MPNEDAPATNLPRGFATTHWSLVLAAGGSSAPDSRQALEELCTRYWHPLYAFARRRGYNEEDARDLTQAFFTKLLEKRDLQAADPSRGRFRTFLLTAMKNFLASEWRRENSLKRGGGVTVLSLDFDSAEAAYRLEPSGDLDPEAIYHRRWAMSVLEQAVADLQLKYQKAGKAELFLALRGFLGGDDDTIPYADLSRRLGQSQGSLRTATSRLRSRWSRRLRELVAETVGQESDIKDELHKLIASVQRHV
jgi:RNA polymerase sigma factor (sigma-70 family)